MALIHRCPSTFGILVIILLVDSSDLDQVIDVVNRETVYDKDKGETSSSKMQTKIRRDGRVGKGSSRDVKGHGDPIRVVELRDRSRF